MGISFTIRKPNIDESQIKTNDPMEKVKQLATLKGHNVPISHEKEVILTADTVVSYKQKKYLKSQRVRKMLIR